MTFSAITCAHDDNVPANPATAYRCRKCGAIIQASNRAVLDGAYPTPNSAPDRVVPSEKAICSIYPGHDDAASLAASNAQ